MPPGKWPWERVEKEVSTLVEKAPGQNQIAIRYRLETPTSFNPGFVAIGQAGFSGYLIFVFPEKNLFVLESLYTGNATYVLEENWEGLLKLTKAEIIRGKMQKYRIIHRENWDYYIIRLFKLARCFAKDVTVHCI